MEQGYLIDSNAVIDYLGNKFPANGMQLMNAMIDAVPKVSIITKIEVLGFNAPPESYLLLEDFMNDAVLFDLTIAVTEQSILLRKSYKIKLPDAIIAATAMVNNMTPITRNTEDFKNIKNLKIINPYLLQDAVGHF